MMFSVILSVEAGMCQESSDSLKIMLLIRVAMALCTLCLNTKKFGLEGLGMTISHR